MLGRDVADELHQRHRLADARAAEQPHLAALVERADQVDDLDARLQDLHLGGLVDVAGRLAVDRPELLRAHVALAVDGRAQHVHDAAQRLRPHRDGHRLPGVVDADAALQAVRRAHRDGAHHAVADLLLHLEGETVLDVQRVVHLGHGVAGELHVHHRADDFYDASGAHGLRRPLSFKRLFGFGRSGVRPRRHRRRSRSAPV